MRPMKILAENPQARTFAALVVCEHCSYEEEMQDLKNNTEFRQVTLPEMPCPKCGRNSKQPIISQAEAEQGIGADEDAIARIQAAAEGGSSNPDQPEVIPPSSDDTIDDDEEPPFDPWADK